MSGNKKKRRYGRALAALLAGALTLGNPCGSAPWTEKSMALAESVTELETSASDGETETAAAEMKDGSDLTTEPETSSAVESETNSGENPGTEENPAGEPASEPETTAETEAAALPESESNSDGKQTETESETGSESKAETESGAETEMGFETEAETESDTEDASETETGTEASCTCGMEEEDPFDHDVACPVFQEALFAACDCGSTSRDIYEHAEDCGAYLTWLSLIEGMDAVELAAMTQTPSGTSVTKASGWTRANASSVFSSAYYPVRFYSGISSLEYFNSSGSVVYGTTDSGKRYLYPKATGQGGKFGAIYRKVLYENNKWYDLRMTVVGYTSSVECDGGGTAASFPFIMMLPNEIGWKFNQALGGLVLKCEFYETGTSTRAAVNTRFQWWDIDGGQRFGFRAADGSIAGRYYYEGSKVYVQTGQTIAGVSGLEVLVGPGEESENTDRKYCATYELKNCSTYYMSFGKRDHINNDNYSYSKTKIKQMNSSLAAGTANADNNEHLKQTDTSLSIIATPEPVKRVSSDGNTWGTQNQLASVGATYWYQISQFVPWQDSSVYYDSFVVQDQLPTGVSYAGSASVIREEDGANLTNSFVISESGGKLTVSAKSTLLSAAGFYGYHYRIRFKAQLQVTKLTPAYSGNTAVYTVSNQASCVYRHSTQSAYTTKTSNKVTTTASVSRSEQGTPVKGLDGQEGKQEKVILMEDDEIIFDIWQNVPENPAAFRPSSIELEDELEDCLELQSVEVQLLKKGSSAWLTMTGWNQSQTGNTLKLSRACETSWEGGRLHFQLICRLKAGEDLSAWKKTEDDGSVWTEVPNQASVTMTWTHGSPQQVKKQTNTVVVRLRENHIRLTKELDGEDIVWAHGNPTFTFRIQGQDLNGVSHVYYRTVEFEEGTTAETGKVTLTAEAVVPAGTWEAAEEKTMRYALKEIYGVQNGSAGEQSAVFDLTAGGDGTAVFYNIKTTDQDESHTSFVRNVIG